MSLDVYLEISGAKINHIGSGIFVRENGQTKEISKEEWDKKFPGREPIVAKIEDESDTVYSANITHNLNTMADKAGIYKHLWRPEEIGIKYANQLIQPLSIGLSVLKNDPDKFKKYNPSNGWGNYKGLINFIEKYLNACKKYPTAEIRVWR